METRVKSVNFDLIASLFDKKWSFAHNYVVCDGGRIWIMWNPEKVNLIVWKITNQITFCDIHLKSSNKSFKCSFVYASNNPINQKQAWTDIVGAVGTFSNHPWIVMGDFNATRNSYEKLGVNNMDNSYSNDLNNMCSEANLEDLNYNGNFFT